MTAIQLHELSTRIISKIFVRHSYDPRIDIKKFTELIELKLAKEAKKINQFTKPEQYIEKEIKLLFKSYMISLLNSSIGYEIIISFINARLTIKKDLDGLIEQINIFIPCYTL